MARAPKEVMNVRTAAPTILTWIQSICRVLSARHGEAVAIMALVGTCGFGKLGTWRRRAIVVFLILGLAALATLRGVTEMLRAPSIEPFAPEGAVHRERGADDGSTSVVRLQPPVPIARYARVPRRKSLRPPR
jgi:hypothetical protein